MVKGVLTSLKNWLLLAKNSIVVFFFFLSFFFILVGVDCLLFISHCRVNDLEFWLSNTLTKTTTVTCLCSYLVMSIYCSIELWIKVMFFWVCFVFHYVSYLFLLVCPVILSCSLDLFSDLCWRLGCSMSCELPMGCTDIHVLRLLVHVLGICYCCCKTIRWFCQ